jgi:hypothetical protein
MFHYRGDESALRSRTSSFKLNRRPVMTIGNDDKNLLNESCGFSEEKNSNRTLGRTSSHEGLEARTCFHIYMLSLLRGRILPNSYSIIRT